MTWFKVDDNLAMHPKIIEAGNEAMGLWVRAGSWCGAHLTDGFVPDHMVAVLGTKRLANRLVNAGLWAVAPGGFCFHEWLERQPSREEEEAKRKSRAEAGRLGGRASGQSRRSSRETRDRSSSEASASASASSKNEPRPDPTRSAAAAALATPPPQPVDNGFVRTLPARVEILRTALEASLLRVRWDQLSPERVQAIERLVELHGDAPLVAAAVRSHRPDRPAAFAQAWIGVWESLPAPGSRLRVVEPRCDRHIGHDGRPQKLKHCGCALTDHALTDAQEASS